MDIRFSPKSRAILTLCLIYMVTVFMEKVIIGAAVLGVVVQAGNAYLFFTNAHVTDTQLIVPPICALVIICAYVIRKKIPW